MRLNSDHRNEKSYRAAKDVHTKRARHTETRLARDGGPKGAPGIVSSISAEAFKKSERGHEEKGRMMKHLCGIGDFVRSLRIQARFGALSRAPLRLLRVQLSGETVECDWVARSADKWDAALPPDVGERNASMQALEDAIKMRELLFLAIPNIYTAVLRVYRQTTSGDTELIIAGTVSKDQKAPATVRSLAMRAKLMGLRFWLDEGVLENLQPSEYAVGF
jgi:hypothetical protein